MPEDNGGDLESQIRQLLRSFKGVSAVVAICYKTPGKGKSMSYVVQTTGDDKCEQLADMLVAITRTPEIIETTEESDED